MIKKLLEKYNTELINKLFDIMKENNLTDEYSEFFLNCFKSSEKNKKHQILYNE